MRIAIFDNVPPGGAARVIQEQIQYLQSQGHKIFWYTSGDKAINGFSKDISIYRHHLNTLFPEKNNIITKAFWLCVTLKQAYQKLYSQIVESKPDCILVHPCRFTQSPYLLQLSNIPTVYFIEESQRVVYEPKIHSLNHLNIISRWAAIVERRILKKIDTGNIQSATYLLTHSTYCAQSIKRNYGLIAKPIGLGVDTRVFKKSNPTNFSSPYFLFIGEKNEINGFSFLQKAILHKEINVKYVSAEKGKLPLSDVQLVKLYSRAIATLCLARKEPFGLVALESMACSTPVIAIAEGGYKETILKNKTGLLIKRQPKSLSEAIEYMLDKKNQMRLSRQCRKHVITNYSWDSHGKNLSNIINDIPKST